MSSKRKNKSADSDLKALSIEARQRLVFKLRIRGLSQERVAEIVHVNPKTVKRDEKEIVEKSKKWLRGAIKKFDTEQYWTSQIEELRHIKDELWSVYSEGDARDRVKAMIEIKEIQKEIDHRMRAAGIKTADVNPEDMANNTVRVIHEYPED